MTALTLYLDEDSMDRSLVRALRTRGVDVATALEHGLARRSDEDQLEYATSHGRTLYTFNAVDFCRLHASYLTKGRHHAGIIVALQQQYSVGEQMRRLLRLIASRTADDMRDSMEFLSVWG